MKGKKPEVDGEWGAIFPFHNLASEVTLGHICCILLVKAGMKCYSFKGRENDPTFQWKNANVPYKMNMCDGIYIGEPSLENIIYHRNAVKASID